MISVVVLRYPGNPVKLVIDPFNFYSQELVLINNSPLNPVQKIGASSLCC